MRSCLRRLDEPLPDVLWLRGYNEPGPRGYWIVRRMFSYSRRSQFGKEPVLSESPPNLTINVDGAIPGQITTGIFLLTGLLIQAVVFTINALAVYRWRWLRGGRLIAPYGYPVWAVGTFIIAIGTSICAWVVESSSWKFGVCPLSADNTGDHQPQIVFLQRKIPELNIPAYLIRPIRPGGILTVSTRIWPPTGDYNNEASFYKETKKREILTALGAFLALGGFICQNIGTRELHWSAGVLQLGATLLLTIIRVWLRRGIGQLVQSNIKDPKKIPNSSSSKKTEAKMEKDVEIEVTELDSGFEAGDLATRLLKYHCALLSTTSEYVPFGLNHITQMMFPDLPVVDFPGFDISEIRHLMDEGEKYKGTLSSDMKAQTLLAEVEPDIDEVAKISRGCYETMKSILQLIRIDEAKDQVLLRELDDFIYMTITKWSADAEQRENLNISAMTVSHFPFKSEDNIPLYVQAIISLTRHKYKDMIKKSGERDESQSVIRFVGYCDLSNVETYYRLLKAWTGLQNLVVSDVQKDRETTVSGNCGLHYEYGFYPRCVVFGLPLSYAFQNGDTLGFHLSQIVSSSHDPDARQKR
jgi:hypothetical protein